MVLRDRAFRLRSCTLGRPCVLGTLGRPCVLAYDYQRFMGPKSVLNDRCSNFFYSPATHLIEKRFLVGTSFTCPQAGILGVEAQIRSRNILDSRCNGHVTRPVLMAELSAYCGAMSDQQCAYYVLEDDDVSQHTPRKSCVLSHQEDRPFVKNVRVLAIDAPLLPPSPGPAGPRGLLNAASRNDMRVSGPNA